MENHCFDDELDKMESDIAVLIARISSSYLNRAAQVKEPYDMTTAMIPVAYAFFDVLIRSGNGSGHEHEWHQFLLEALNERLNHAAGASFQ